MRYGIRTWILKTPEFMLMYIKIFFKMLKGVKIFKNLISKIWILFFF